MRILWPLATLVLVAAVVVLYARDRVGGCDTVEEGGRLHLTRSSVDTVRARFCYASDCKLIAAQMSKIEHAIWSCD